MPRANAVYDYDKMCISSVCCLLLVLLCGVTGCVAPQGPLSGIDANTSEVWREFLAARRSGRNPDLPDYSYAGYRFSAVAPPEPKGRIFDVTDYGAVPDDEKEDREGIQAAIHAAEKAGGGIVFFPPGRFLVNEEKGRREGIMITRPNVFLKGSGAGMGGTELYMKWHMLPRDPQKKYSVPKMFTFRLPPEMRTYRKYGSIAADSQRETFFVTMDDASALKPGDMVDLRMQNKAANDYLLDGLTPWDTWTVIRTDGARISEKHEVARVEGNKVFFTAPLHIDIHARYGWEVWNYPTAKGWGFSDVHFRGSWREEFVHHKDSRHDSGIGFLRLERGYQAIVRRIRLTDVNEGISMPNNFCSSALFITADGHQGHGWLALGGSGYGNLAAFLRDATDKGQFHGPATSSSSVGSVVYCFRVKTTGTGRMRGGPDYHGSYPYASLLDTARCPLVNNGGNVANLPNHGRWLTWWNVENIGKAHQRYDFFDPQGKRTYTGCKIVRPVIVGFTGATTFREKHVGQLASYGKNVSPASLFEAQLALRLGSVPAWLIKAKEQWSKNQ